MNHTEMTYVLTGAEIYALAAVRGIGQIFGLFDEESFPDSRQLPVVLASLAQKGLIYPQDGRLMADSGVDRLMSCYVDWDIALALYFADESLPDICAIRGGSGILCSEGVLHQPNAVRMRLTDTDGVREQLEESGCLERIPACPPHTAVPDSTEDKEALQNFLTIKIQRRDGECTESAVLIGSAGCCVTDGGELRYAHREGILTLITDALSVDSAESGDILAQGKDV